MKFGYLNIHSIPLTPPSSPKKEKTWWGTIKSCFVNIANHSPSVYIESHHRIIININGNFYNLRVCNTAETTIVPYGSRWTATSFPRRILFNDTCVIAEHYDPYTHNNCDPIMSEILGEHPEFQVCLSSLYNGSYTTLSPLTNEPISLFAMCRVKNYPDHIHKYIFAYDDMSMNELDACALLRNVLIGS